MEILSTIDKAIQKTNEIIAKTERLKRGLMQELLTKGLGHKEFKDTEIGRIPKDWEVVRLGELVDIQSGKYFAYSEFCKKRCKMSKDRQCWIWRNLLGSYYLSSKRISK